jgi:uncharacterized membrane protein YhaH (DUF805 family)
MEPAQHPAPLPRPPILRLWFGFKDPVDRRAYLTSGFLLMAVKYGVDALLVYFTMHTIWSPLSYLNPIYSLRVAAIHNPPAWLAASMALFALPFMWIGVTMSVRRAVDAGMSPWTGVLFMIPLVNYVIIGILASRPSLVGAAWNPRPPGPYRDMRTAPPEVQVDGAITSAMLGVLGSTILGLGMVGISVYVLGSYGWSLFMLTPFIMGALSAFLYNRKDARDLRATIMVALASCLIAGGAMMLFALEGLFCLAMAFPIAAGIAVLGAVVGRSIAIHARTSNAPAHAAAMVLLLPGVATVEAKIDVPRLHEVISTVEIDAPPEKVWNNVVGFSELPAPAEAIFRTGIAFPMRAHIEGSGVGAVRYCEFSTGPFVEPITVWEPGHRLGFDVRSQPDAMKEWSPFRAIHPPHLDASIRSKRGEFRLFALPGGRTRLEGSTWYELSMAPEAYWAVWSDGLIHAIHQRVLNHVKHLTESS